MTVVVPSSLALTSIADGASAVAADHRNNFTAVQVGVNGLVAMFNVAPTKGDLVVSAGGGSFDKLGVGTNTQVLTADSTQALGVKWASVAASELAYAQETSNSIAPAATTEATATTIATAGAITLDGSTRIEIEGNVARAQKGTTFIAFAIYDGASSIGILGRLDGTGSLRASMFLTPSAASHTYSLRAWVDAGSGFINSGPAGTAAAFAPAFIRVKRA